MKKLFEIILVVVLGWSLVACGPETNDVASLGPIPPPEAGDEILSNEDLMLEFAACLRAQGLEVMDPIVDSDGNVDKPQVAEGITKKELGAAYEACDPLLENFTFEGKKTDQSDDLDYYLELAVCLREEGIEVSDPTTETLDTWMGDFKTTTDFDDPDTVKAFETCTDGDFYTGGGKGE